MTPSQQAALTTAKRLTPRQLAGQLIVGGFEGPTPPKECFEALERGERAGLILFRRNLSPGRQGLTDCQGTLERVLRAAPAELPPLVSVDEEGGRVQRLRPPALNLPPLRRVADAWGAAGLRRVATVVGKQLRCLGFNLNYAPVVDVDTNPNNPIIGDRALGDTPQTVIDAAGAYLDGLERTGVLGCIKHFPGHGDTAVDSHLVRPVLQHSIERLSRIELRPFEALVGRAPAVMVAHLLCPSLDPQTIASLSPAVVKGWLRERMGFEGVVFTDALEMKALSDHCDLGAGAVQALCAGCDVVLPCDTWAAQQQVHEALERAIVDGEVVRRQAQEAVARNLAMRRSCPPSPGSAPALDALLNTEIAELERDFEALPSPSTSASSSGRL